MVLFVICMSFTSQVAKRHNVTANLPNFNVYLRRGWGGGRVIAKHSTELLEIDKFKKTLDKTTIVHWRFGRTTEFPTKNKQIVKSNKN